MTLAELTPRRGRPTEAERNWALAVRKLYTERLQQLMPTEYVTADWEQARATYDALDSTNLGRDYDRSLYYLDDFNWEFDPTETRAPGLRYGDEVDYDWAKENDPVGEFREITRVAQGAAERARVAGELAEVDRQTQQARRATLAADELALDVDSGRTLDPEHVAAERDWIRASDENARLIEQQFPSAVPLLASAGRRREAERALDERVAGHVEWAHALRAVHFHRAQAEWRRLVRDGAEPSDELAVRAREGVHLRDEKLAALVPMSTDTLRRAGELPVRDTAPPTELRERHAALTRRIDEASYLWERTGVSDAASVAELSALRSAADDLAMSEGYAPEAFAADADEPRQPAAAPRRRRAIDLLPKLPRPPARPTPESVTQQSASASGPSSGPDFH